MASLIRVFVCDDHLRVRLGLRKLVECEPDLVVVGEAGNAEEAIAGVQAEQPDVLLLDVAMPGRSGIDALPDLRDAGPKTRMLVVSMQDDPVYVREAFAAGASGYLLKEAADAELVQAIHDVAEGRRYLHPVLRALLVAVGSPGNAPADPLSEREHAVLRLLALGRTNQEIAKLLLISLRTAETHRARIVKKLGVRTRAEIVRYALASGELDARRGQPA